MNFATKTKYRQGIVWIVWLLVFLVAMLGAYNLEEIRPNTELLLGMETHDERLGYLFPWQAYYQRWKKQSLRRYRVWKKQYHQAKRTAMLAQLVLLGVMPLARLVEWITKRQVHYQVGALPVLYALLETLNVRHIINRYCSTQSKIDHGTVAMVLILNRLMFPLPMYQVSDWVGQTILAATLKVPAEKFNDDRLERTLDAIYPHLESIWTEIVTVAIRKADIDLSVIFYDLTAFIVHGNYEESELIDFGFAHNTPNNKRKFKLALNTTADGNLPWLYHLWSGRMADQATVQDNMENLAHWLDQHRLPRHKTLIIGDRAMLSAKIAVTYDQADLQYLSGLRVIQTQHKALLKVWNDAQFEAFPIISGHEPQYWGRGCRVSFTHEGHTVKHKGLVVVSGPLRDQLRQSRRERLQDLDATLSQVRQEIGQPRMRTIKIVQRRVNARLKDSKVGKLIDASVYETPDRTVNLVWQINRTKLAQVERLDGRYLLVTNNRDLSHKEIFQLYRDKDGGEKRFFISKNDLVVTPIYLHKDKRIASMMMLNMIALLAYSLLERQMREQGLDITTRKLLKRLRNLTMIETHYLDGSVTRHLTPLTPEIQVILPLLAMALETLTENMTITQSPFILPNPHPILRLPALC